MLTGRPRKLSKSLRVKIQTTLVKRHDIKCVRKIWRPYYVAAVELNTNFIKQKIKDTVNAKQLHCLDTIIPNILGSLVERKLIIKLHVFSSRTNCTDAPQTKRV